MSTSQFLRNFEQHSFKWHSFKQHNFEWHDFKQLNFKQQETSLLHNLIDWSWVNAFLLVLYLKQHKQ